MKRVAAVVSLLVAVLAVCASAGQAPDSFTLTFHTTVGGGKNVTVEVARANAPIGVDHLYELLTLSSGSYYDQNGFFRVVPGFVVQFGISGSPAESAKWEADAIKDDPVRLSNTRGVLTYATAGPNTRTTQLFINTGDNSFLDKEGFSGLGTVTHGMDVVDAIYAGYGQTPDQSKIYASGNAYLHADFPRLDFIKTTSVSTATASNE